MGVAPKDDGLEQVRMLPLEATHALHASLPHVRHRYETRHKNQVARYRSEGDPAVAE